MSSRPDASWWARNRQYVALACAATAAGVAAYQLAHPRLKATQAALQRAADTLDKYSNAAASAGEALVILSADIKQFLASDADELPPSLRQLGKLVRSQEMQDTLASCIASAVKGMLASGIPAADGAPGEPSVVDKVIEAVLSDRGQSLVGLAVRTAAQTSSETFCAALQTGIEAAMGFPGMGGSWGYGGAASSSGGGSGAGCVVDPAALGPMSTLVSLFVQAARFQEFRSLMVDVSRSSTREFVLSLLPASWSLAARNGSGGSNALASAALTAALYRVYSAMCVMLFLMVYALGPKTLEQ
ncbi:hypothetical protein OEZ85_012718 [Tetradesmus obliquus]|uniref:Protein PHLOEM PROTEIN 2-LIKE A10 n=1 Tax=Tetradesmus obliquus TaxID=3088 RepID=A0ABY8U6D7_TETOB|nr:hypothetical protein OEZ85_012718 [Tetradesmus obliquus]